VITCLCSHLCLCLCLCCHPDSPSTIHICFSVMSPLACHPLSPLRISHASQYAPATCASPLVTMSDSSRPLHLGSTAGSSLGKGKSEGGPAAGIGNSTFMAGTEGGRIFRCYLDVNDLAAKDFQVCERVRGISRGHGHRQASHAELAHALHRKPIHANSCVAVSNLAAKDLPGVWERAGAGAKRYQYYATDL
jgi:hypothetical protein